MKILFDHCVPRPLRHYFTGHLVETTAENGWQGLSNGKLLDAAEQAGFDVFLTVDGNLPYQQNLSGRGIRLVVLEAANSRTPTLAPLVTSALEILPTLIPGSVYRIQGALERENRQAPEQER